MALEPGVTVVPAAVWGSQRPLRPVEVVFGEPLDLADLAGGCARASARGSPPTAIVAGRRRTRRTRGRPAPAVDSNRRAQRSSATDRTTSRAAPTGSAGTCFTSLVLPARAGRPTASERRAEARERRTATIASIGDGLPVVAIVGYPNVGKSTLFNRLTGRREAVVDERPGVTRDRRETDRRLAGTGVPARRHRRHRRFATRRPSAGRSSAQAATAIDEADLILFVIDAQAGAAAGDLDVAERLRRAQKPVFVIANKCDDERHEVDAQALWAPRARRRDPDLGPARPRRGRPARRDRRPAARRRPRSTWTPPLRRPFAILGRPNVGQEQHPQRAPGRGPRDRARRAGYHPRPGRHDHRGRWQRIVLTDTAGLRKRGKSVEIVERYSHLRAVQSADRSDVAIVVCDAVEGITDADLCRRRLRRQGPLRDADRDEQVGPGTTATSIT